MDFKGIKHMNFVDKTLLRLTDSATRTALFDNIALEQVVSAAYDTDNAPVQGPYNPLFDELRLGFAVSRVQAFDGIWGPVGGTERMEARFSLAGMGESSLIQVDALWRGGIVARMVTSADRVTKVATALPNFANIDADIIAALGALPASSQQLEQERRTRVITRIRRTMQQPDALTDAAFDAWLGSIGASSAGDLLTRTASTLAGDTVQVTFSPPAADNPTPKLFPITAALLIREANFSVTQLLAESKLLREQIEPLGLERGQDPSLRPRNPVVIVWIVPEQVFDDSDWPGGQPGMNADALRGARRSSAGTWLAREGIGLVATK